MSYRSKLEKQVGGLLGDQAEYEPDQWEYDMIKTYTPDFALSGDALGIWLEVKGRFRTFDEAAKYIAIRNCWGHGYELVFVISNPDVRAYPQARRRKDGTFLTLANWLDKNGFRWVTADRVKEVLTWTPRFCS